MLDLKKERVRVLIVGLVCIFIFLIVYSPHFSNPFPIHIDEWYHITNSLMLKNLELNSIHVEFGFHVFLLILSFFSNLVLIYKFLPAIWAIISALVLFFIFYKKTNKNFYIALFSMIFFASIKSNVNLEGLWFFIPLTFSIPFIFLYIYLFTEGIEKKNKKYILISLLIMSLLVIVHSISVLFAIPFLLIYSLFHYKYLLKEYKFFLIFLIIPVIGIIFFMIIKNTNLISVISKIIEGIQFKKGWGILELNNSPLEVYSLVGYILAAIGVGFMFFLKEYRKYSAYLLWPATLIISIIIFKLTDVSYLSPYQRNFYYLTISIPFLSAYGLFYLLKFAKEKLKPFIRKEIIIKVILLIILLFILFFTFISYFNLPGNSTLYKVINNEDYSALKFLSNYSQSIVLADPMKSMAIYPVSGHNIVAGIFFFGTAENKKDSTEFFSDSANCTFRDSVVKKYNVSYILSNDKIDCNYSLIYDKGNISIYKT